LKKFPSEHLQILGNQGFRVLPIQVGAGMKRKRRNLTPRIKEEAKAERL
jgi:hypothetical protein